MLENRKLPITDMECEDCSWGRMCMILYHKQSSEQQKEEESDHASPDLHKEFHFVMAAEHTEAFMVLGIGMGTYDVPGGFLLLLSLARSPTMLS